MKKFASIVFLLGLTPLLQAQQTAQPTPRPVPPPAPWLEKASDFAQWTVTTKSSGASIAPKPGETVDSTPATVAGTHSEKPKPELTDYRTVVVKTKPIRYEQTVVGGGMRTTVKWFLPDLQISTENGSVPVVTYANSRNATDINKADFPGFEWISARNYEGIQKVAGQDCLIFREALKIDGKVVTSDPQLMMVACISLESRLPLALQLGDEVRAYQFGNAPTALLTLPPEIETLAAQWRNVTRQSSRPVAKP